MQSMQSVLSTELCVQIRMESPKIFNKYKRYCCVCHNNNQNVVDKSIIFHSFPKNKYLLEKWIIDCNLTIKPNSRTAVCSKHFSEDDYLPIRLDDGRRGHSKILKKIAVPSLLQKSQCEYSKKKFTPAILKTTAKQKKGVAEIKKSSQISNSSTTINCSTPTSSVVSADSQLLPSLEQSINCFTPSSSSVDPLVSVNQPSFMPVFSIKKCFNECDISECSEIDSEETRPEYEFVDVKSENVDCNFDVFHDENIKTEKVEELKIIKNRSKEVAQNKKVTLTSLIKTKEDLVSFTGVNFKLLNNLTRIVDKVENKTKKTFSLSSRDRVVLCLTKLRTNLSFRCLGVLFGITRQSCSNNFIYMVQLFKSINKIN